MKFLRKQKRNESVAKSLNSWADVKQGVWSIKVLMWDGVRQKMLAHYFSLSSCAGHSAISKSTVEIHDTDLVHVYCSMSIKGLHCLSTKGFNS